MDFENAIENIVHQLTYIKGEPMLFSSGLFWVLFLIFIPLYSALKSRRTQMTVFVIAFSLFFYYKSSGLFVGLLIGTSLVDWLLSRQMMKVRHRWQRCLCVAVSLTLSLGILAYFKYANFFMWNWQQMVGGNFSPMDIILPVGISFYTFQSISYMVDVYKGLLKPARRWLDYAFFLSFFPSLLAGPITRARFFLPQLEQNRHATRDMVYTGFWLILLGVIKKAIVADYLSQYNDLIFSVDPETGVLGYSGFETMMGIIGYTIQIYCDFSGYSDMAIGIALIMGFKLAPNFNFPYKSRNLTDFWRRWHISLSSWLRDYVYIPLGGNRKGTVRTYVNNFATMVIGGLWHGAAWQFVFWGAMHGAGLAVHKASKPWLSKVPDTWPVKALSWAVTMATVCLLWVFFRSGSFTDSLAIIGHAFSDFDIAYLVPFATVRWLWLILMFTIIIAHALPTGFWNKAGDWFVRSPWIVKLLIFIIIIQLVLELRGEDVAPFIYYQF